MSIKDVVYRVVHSYPGGVAAMAARMGKNPNTLQSKINPNLDTHHTTAEELEQIQMFSNSPEIAKHFAGQMNMVCFPVTEHEGTSDMELLDLFINMEKEKAEWLASIQKSLSDGVIDPVEAVRIKRESREHIAIIAELTSRIDGMVIERRKTPRGRV